MKNTKYIFGFMILIAFASMQAMESDDSYDQVLSAWEDQDVVVIKPSSDGEGQSTEVDDLIEAFATLDVFCEEYERKIPKDVKENYLDQTFFGLPVSSPLDQTCYFIENSGAEEGEGEGDEKKDEMVIGLCKPSLLDQTHRCIKPADFGSDSEDEDSEQPQPRKIASKQTNTETKRQPQDVKKKTVVHALGKGSGSAVITFTNHQGEKVGPSVVVDDPQKRLAQQALRKKYGMGVGSTKHKRGVGSTKRNPGNRGELEAFGRFR